METKETCVVCPSCGLMAMVEDDCEVFSYEGPEDPGTQKPNRKVVTCSSCGYVP